MPASAMNQANGRTIQIACKSVWLRKTRLQTGMTNAETNRTSSRVRPTESCVVRVRWIRLPG